MAAWHGEQRSLASLLYEPKHSLEHQSYAPSELLHGSVNVDGTGVAWWPADGTGGPLRYVTDRPAWADPNLPDLAPRLSSYQIVASVRSGTPGLSFGSVNVSPFTRGELAFTHNGRIDGFRGPVGRELIGLLDDSVFDDLAVVNDSRVLFLLTARYFEDSGSLANALTRMYRDVTEVLERHDANATLNVLAGDRNGLAALKASVGFPVNSLHGLSEDGGHLVASEPLDDRAGWHPVPDYSLVEISGKTLKTTPLEEVSNARRR